MSRNEWIPSLRGARRSRGWLAAGLGVWFVAVGCRIEPTNGNGAPAAAEPDLTAQVQTILDTQAGAWNAGDLDAFMSVYERSPSTTFVGATGLLEGFDSIRARYAPSFGPGAIRDSLDFEALKAREIDPRFAIVTARYVLRRDGSVTSTGPFTLVLVNVEGEWRIVHDQSAEDPSSAEPSPTDSGQ